MHDAVRQWVARFAKETEYPTVIEVGSRNINGTIRDQILAKEWIGIDIIDGPCVDIVGDAIEYIPDFRGRADLVLCLEALEHYENTKFLTYALGQFAKPGALVIATAAGPGRGEHSGIDENPIREYEHYRNLGVGDFEIQWGEVVGCEIKDADWRVCWRRTHTPGELKKVLECETKDGQTVL